MTTVWPEEHRSETCWNFLTSITDPWNLTSEPWECIDIVAKVFITIGMIIATAGLGLIGIIVGASILCHREIQQQSANEDAAAAQVQAPITRQQDAQRLAQQARDAAQSRRETNELLARLEAEAAARINPEPAAIDDLERPYRLGPHSTEIRETEISFNDCYIFWSAVGNQHKIPKLCLTYRIHMKTHSSEQSYRSISHVIYNFHRAYLNRIKTLTIPNAAGLKALPDAVARLAFLKELILIGPTSELLNHPDFELSTQGLKVVADGRVIQDLPPPETFDDDSSEGEVY